MKVIKYEPLDVLNGVGGRVVVWCSLCSHGCEGCFNKDSWGNVGKPLDEDFITRIISDLSKPYCKGLTLSGGDPLHNHNIKETLWLCNFVRETLPNKDIWIYTGYTLLEIQSSSKLSPILDCIDYLVDGRFDINLKVRDKFFGSSNQKIYHIIDGVPVLDKSLN